MPPEIKSVISSLAEMTCENCVYSYSTIIGSVSIVEWQCNNPEAKKPIYSYHKAEDFCAKGKWLTDQLLSSTEESAKRLWIANYDACFFMFGRGK